MDDAASRNLADLRTADMCIAFAPPVGRQDEGRGGRHVEFGVALTWEIPVMLVGPHEHLFHALAVATYPAWDGFTSLVDDWPYARLFQPRGPPERKDPTRQAAPHMGRLFYAVQAVHLEQVDTHDEIGVNPIIMCDICE